MSETQPAPEGGAPDAGTGPAETAPEGTAAPAEGTEGAAEPKPEPAKPEREPWFVKRIAELTRANADRDRVLAAAERKLQELQPNAQPSADDPQRAVETRAQQIVAQRAFDTSCNEAHAAGVAAYPDFADAMKTLGSVGGMPNTVIEAALETGEAHKVLYALGRNPERAVEIAAMSPARMGVAMAKLAAQPAAAAPVTKAPAPVRSISGGTVRSNDDPEKMTQAEYSAWRNKQIAARMN